MELVTSLKILLLWKWKVELASFQFLTARSRRLLFIEKGQNIHNYDPEIKIHFPSFLLSFFFVLH